MIKPSYESMNKIITDAGIAFRYAEEHFEELRNRDVAHILFGAQAYGMGAAGPCSLTKRSQRKLTKKARRQVYTSYELDSNFQILCSRDYNGIGIDCSVYFFELDDILYARPFLGDRNAFYKETVYCLKKSGDTPIFYAEAEPKYLFVQYYEYLNNDKVLVTSISYRPASEITVCGYPMSLDAPYGAPNSPIQIHVFEDVRYNIDFSQWFR